MIKTDVQRQKYIEIEKIDAIICLETWNGGYTLSVVHKLSRTAFSWNIEESKFSEKKIQFNKIQDRKSEGFLLS